MGVAGADWPGRVGTGTDWPGAAGAWLPPGVAALGFAGAGVSSVVEFAVEAARPVAGAPDEPDPSAGRRSVSVTARAGAAPVGATGTAGCAGCLDVAGASAGTPCAATCAGGGTAGAIVCVAAGFAVSVPAGFTGADPTVVGATTVARAG